MLIGCHALVWNGSQDGTSIENSIRRTAEAGFDLLEIPLMNLADFNTSSTKKTLASHGLSATASLGLTAGTDLSSEDTDVVAAGEALLGRCLEIVHELESGHLCGVIYSAMQKYQQPASERGRNNSSEAIRRLAERAAALGITLSLEIVNRYESNLLNTAGQGIQFLTEVDHNNVRLHLDTYHMNIEEPDLYSPVVATGQKLGYVHIGESHRGYLGSGSVDFGSFFRALSAVDYDGPIVFESFSSAVVSGELSNTLGVWRNLWTDSAELGAHANRYIRDQLTAIKSIKLH
ncbi:sugar phosphate isomerase/epimerase family protein [Arthrobacter sp. TMN-50]